MGRSTRIKQYLCRFIETDDAVFRHEDIAHAVSNDVEPLFGGGVIASTQKYVPLPGPVDLPPNQKITFRPGS